MPLSTRKQGFTLLKSMSRRSDRLQAKQAKSEGQKDDTIQSKKRKPEECSDHNHETEVSKRRRQFQIQNCWTPIVPGGVSPCILIPTPHKDADITEDFSRFSQYRFKNLFLTKSPLPPLSWGNSEDVWSNMLRKEIQYIHSKNVLSPHPSLQPKMRAILLDWLIEVCEVYVLHRETFYLAQDFFDRFMVTQENIHKSKLQLIGISSLFIAAKLEVSTYSLAGLEWDSISACFNWMVPFAKTLNEGDPLKLRDFKQVADDERHNIQTHTKYLELLEEAHIKKAERTARLSPVSIGGILTPPKSTEKPLPSSTY
ncbi:G1/S-specific cyclin-E2 [Rhincodon typus]|uniref:G1/S-specific cyclin-E2 n=1 Tax=Rhincodon typus TaxID=259920 RepID=UPI00202DED94|nr:G1/S-specific cyclin-E2 [Rhincodon typus]